MILVWYLSFDFIIFVVEERPFAEYGGFSKAKQKPEYDHNSLSCRFGTAKGKALLYLRRRRHAINNCFFVFRCYSCFCSGLLYLVSADAI